MKKLITLFAIFLGLGIANAQEKKPTKEETIDYINNKLSQIVFNEEKDNGSRPITTTITYKSSIIENCVLRVSYTLNREVYDKNSFGYVKATDQIEIPLNKIEKIDKNYGLSFYVYQKAKSISYSRKGVSNVFRDKEESIDSKENLSQISLNMYQSDAEELIKAFNHLRKLCGAPEPLSFD